MKKISIDCQPPSLSRYALEAAAAIALIAISSVMAPDRLSPAGAIVVSAVVFAVASWSYLQQAAFISSLADEVFDSGDSLLVRKDELEQKLPLTNVLNVIYAASKYRSVVTLTLDRAGPFGSEISFIPDGPDFANVNDPNPTAQDLTLRAARARRQRAAPGT